MSLKFIRTRILKDLGVLLSGSFIAQIIPLLLQPVLKTIYEPEVFGVYEVFFRTGSLLFIIFTLRYEVSLFYPRTLDTTKKLVAMITVISLFFLIITELIFVIGDQGVSNMLELPFGYNYVLYLIPLAAFSYAIFRVWTNYYISREFLKKLNFAKVSRRITEGSLQVIIGLLGKSYGLLLGDLIGVLGTACYMMKKEGIRLKYLFDFKGHFSSMKKYIDIPKYGLFPDLLNTFTDGILVFLVVKEFTFQEAGYLELALKILIVPTALLVSNMGPLIVQRITKAINHNESFFKDLNTIFIILAVVAAMFIGSIFLFGESVFNLLFSNEWSESFDYVKILVVYAAVQLIVAPFGQILIAFKKFGLDAFWKIFKFLGLSILFFIDFESVESLLKTFTVVASLVYFFYAMLIFLVVKKYLLEKVKS